MELVVKTSKMELVVKIVNGFKRFPANIYLFNVNNRSTRKTKLSPKSWTGTTIGFESGTFRFSGWGDITLSFSQKLLTEITSQPTKNSSFWEIKYFKPKAQAILETGVPQKIYPKNFIKFAWNIMMVFVFNWNCIFSRHLPAQIYQ